MEKVAVIGTGFISVDKHLPAWRRLRPSARVVALCDLDRDSAERAARRFDVPSAYDDVRDMLEREKPDFVDICTPPRTHADIAAMALEAGAHVLIEKPMAMSVEECDRIIEAETESGKRVGVVHSELFYPPLVEARKRVQRGDIGEFKGMRILRSVSVDYMTANADHWANRLPGGVIGETGPHLVYHTLAFINPIRHVWVHARKLMPQYPWSPFDDYRIELIGEHATSSIVFSCTNHHWAAPIDIWGSDGLLRVDLQGKTLVRSDRPDLSPKTIGISSIREAAQIAVGTFTTSARFLAGRFRNTHEILIEEFFDRAVRGLAPPVTSQEGRETVRVMNTIVGRLDEEGHHVR